MMINLFKFNTVYSLHSLCWDNHYKYIKLYLVPVIIIGHNICTNNIYSYGGILEGNITLESVKKKMWISNSSIYKGLLFSYPKKKLKKWCIDQMVKNYYDSMNIIYFKFYHIKKKV